MRNVFKYIPQMYFPTIVNYELFRPRYEIFCVLLKFLFNLHTNLNYVEDEKNSAFYIIDALYDKCNCV